MRYVSLFSGIEAASVAWEPLGWEPMAFAEIEPFPCAVLRERFPAVPNLGDVCEIDWKEFVEENGRPDVIVGGSPCQSFSVAGGRESLSGESRLCFEYVRAIREARPEWFVWENVPGVLHTRDNAFGQFISALWDSGCRDMSWRVLDAQFFGLAQRRRRVYLVGRVGDGLRSAAVLFERDSLRGDHPSGSEKRKELAARAGGGAAGGDSGCMTPCVYGFAQNTRDEVRFIGGDGQVAGALAASQGMKQTTYVLASTQSHASVDADLCGCVTAHAAKDAPVACTQYGNIAGTLTARHDSSPCADRGQNIVCISRNAETVASNGQDIISALCARDGKGVGNQYVTDGKVITQREATRYVVRRLTPVECERLQGFPDGWTQVPYRGKAADGCPDTPRYKALGNSMAVPVMRWIGERIGMVDEIGAECGGF